MTEQCFEDVYSVYRRSCQCWWLVSITNLLWLIFIIMGVKS